MAQTKTATALARVMEVADLLDSCEAEIIATRNAGGDVAYLREVMGSLYSELESAWDRWNDAMLEERLARV